MSNGFGAGFFAISLLAVLGVLALSSRLVGLLDAGPAPRERSCYPAVLPLTVAPAGEGPPVWTA